jgi:hypothetical protein
MKKLLIIVMAFGLLLMPFTVYPQSDQKSAGTAPVSQALVSEGDFALKLATALKVGTPTDEAQAEDMLTSAGVAPKNGWIADYPVTPNIIGELQNAVATAADSKKLPMGKDEALKAFRTATVEAGLPIVAEVPGNYPETQPQYAESSAVDDYYSSEGPPVVTYYPPPPDYGYLYAWVPCPFFFDAFFFPGFFVLNDFDIIVAGHHHHHHRITNHFFDSRTHTFGRVDPARHTLTNISHTAAFNSTATRNAASSIFNRSMESTKLSRGTQSVTGNHVSTSNGTQGSKGVVMNNRGNGSGRTFSNSSSIATGSGMDHRSSQSFSRSFSAPSSHGSSSCENCHGGSSSFGGGSSHSFSGFSGGHGGGGGRR